MAQRFSKDHIGDPEFDDIIHETDEAILFIKNSGTLWGAGKWRRRVGLRLLSILKSEDAPSFRSMYVNDEDSTGWTVLEHCSQEERSRGFRARS